MPSAGLAHLHHAWELHVQFQVPLRDALLRTSFQGAYTTVCQQHLPVRGAAAPTDDLRRSLTQVFGAFATLLLLRTGSLAAPVVAHSFCNWQGFPDFSRLLTRGGGTGVALVLGVAAFMITLRAFCASADWRMP